MLPAAMLVLRDASGVEKRLELSSTSVTLGRASHNTIVLDDDRASRTHALLQEGPGGWEVIDLGAANGTYVNGMRVQRATVRARDVIQIGDTFAQLEPGERPSGDDAVRIDSPADLESTLARTVLPVTVSDTNVSRLAIYVPGGKTWEIPLTGDSVTIGRQTSGDVVLAQPQVSRQHARIERQGDDFVLRDLGSTNGTWIGTARVESHTLANGDTIRIGDAQLVFKHAIAPEELTVVDQGGGDRRKERRPVVIVPGFMGSELWLGSERVWPNVRYLFSQPELYSLPNDVPLEPRAIVHDVVVVPNLIRNEQYSRLSTYLQESLGYELGKDLLEFPYDWRQDNRDSARRLAEAIDQWGVSPPITIIAHSMGTLVTRYYVEQLGGKRKVGRVILMGGPHQGVPKVARTLLSRADVLPFGLMGDRLRDVLATFPATYQIAPTEGAATDHEGRPVDLLAEEGWVPSQHVALLRAAREFRQELGTTSSVPAISIFGYGIETVLDLKLRRGQQGGWLLHEFAKRASGDDTIPETSSVLPGSEIHPVQQHHGALYVDNDVKMRLKLELTGR